MKNLIAKYNVPVPRYTSYPPANFFHEGFAESHFLQAVEQSNEEQPQHISFYIHIPFCRRMCYYCGCNSYPMQREEEVGRYIDALKKEIDLVCQKIDKTRQIAQIHYGGGTPTAIPLHYIQEINQLLLSRFSCINEPEIAIECHAGYMTESDFELLIRAGFNRMSIGIQDFNEETLKASNRIAPKLPVETIFDLLRRNNIRINLDFIYGLPLQTAESFSQTIRKAIDLRPDRLVTFSYAHIPQLFPMQKLLERNPLPTTEEKDAIYRSARELLLNSGYRQVGMDHFVNPSDELFIAQQNNSLHRNFQGYCTRRTTGQVYAFGVTAISQLASAYAQNTKDLEEYIAQINRGHIPVKKGYRLNRDEQITREVITHLMCNGLVDWREIGARFNLSVSEVKNATAYNEETLQTFADDGIIELSEHGLKMQQNGSPFVRNVAASIDKLLLKTEKSFSKPI